jgi:hypothetical protein
MTSRVIRGGEGAKFPGELTAVIISCDQMDCSKSINDTEIRAGGGLKNMGWDAVAISGTQRHYCPEHKRS